MKPIGLVLEGESSTVSRRGVHIYIYFAEKRERNPNHTYLYIVSRLVSDRSKLRPELHRCLEAAMKAWSDELLTNTLQWHHKPLTSTSQHISNLIRFTPYPILSYLSPSTRVCPILTSSTMTMLNNKLLPNAHPHQSYKNMVVKTRDRKASKKDSNIQNTTHLI